MGKARVQQRQGRRRRVAAGGLTGGGGKKGRRRQYGGAHPLLAFLAGPAFAAVRKVLTHYVPKLLGTLGRTISRPASKKVLKFVVKQGYSQAITTAAAMGVEKVVRDILKDAEEKRRRKELAGTRLPSAFQANSSGGGRGMYYLTQAETKTIQRVRKGGHGLARKATGKVQPYSASAFRSPARRNHLLMLHDSGSTGILPYAAYQVRRAAENSTRVPLPASRILGSGL